MGHPVLRHEAATPGVAAPGSGAELDAVLQRVEEQLDDLQATLSTRDVQSIERQASELHKALSQAVERFAHAARRGGTPSTLRHRLVRASARVTAQRDALARATAAAERAIDLLMPAPHAAALYSEHGVQHVRGTGSSLEA